MERIRQDDDLAGGQVAGVSFITKAAIILALLIGIPYYWLLIESGPSDAPPHQIDIGRLRLEAGKLAGPLPQKIEVAVPASDHSAGTFLVAGGGLKADLVGVAAYRLVTPGGDTLLDAGLNQTQAKASGFATYHENEQRIVESWLRAARRIIFSGQDIDHIGGFITSPFNAAIAPRVIADAELATRISRLVPAFAKQNSLQIDGEYAAIAPGVAMLRTPGHTPLARMIYVHLANGREFLFAGDTMPMQRNLTWLKPRSRYSSEWAGSEDRTAVIGWLKGLAALHALEPNLVIVPAHDLGWIKTAGRAAGIETGRFVPIPAP